jgi:hypothetical protein
MTTPRESEPREIVVTRAKTWRAVDGPEDCRCGHQHYGRQTRSSQAPNWRFCEDPDCDCTVLRSPRIEAADRIEASHEC